MRFWERSKRLVAKDPYVTTALRGWPIPLSFPDSPRSSRAAAGPRHVPPSSLGLRPTLDNLSGVELQARSRGDARGAQSATPL